MTSHVTNKTKGKKMLVSRPQVCRSFLANRYHHYIEDLIFYTSWTLLFPSISECKIKSPGYLEEFGQHRLIFSQCRQVRVIAHLEGNHMSVCFLRNDFYTFLTKLDSNYFVKGDLNFFGFLSGTTAALTTTADSIFLLISD